MYEWLQKEGRIGRLTIPNRVFMPAMGVNLGSPLGGVTDDLIAYYEARAKGGCGLIITEVTRVEDGVGISDPCQMAARSVLDVPDLERLTDAVHKYDTRLFIQLQHPGRNASPPNGEAPVAPSAIAAPGGATPRALTTEECKAYVQKFVTGAKICQLAGADGVELHAAHGYLINGFLSPAMNQRTDEYGGSFDNRMRFLTEMIAGIRQLCGKSFPISVRLNAEEALPGGIDLKQAAQIALAAQQAGADAINVSCYSEGCIEPGTYAQGWKKYMAAAIKQAVQVPVLAVCNLKDPSAAEELLRAGVCDFAGVGRGHLADAAWCQKAFEGREAEIRKCIGCMNCFGEIVKPLRVKCGVNPITGREREYAHPTLNGGGRKVAVIGAGPAGVQAALVLKQRGFEPILMDTGSRIGGTLNVADKGYGKEKITRYCESLAAELEAAGVETRLNETATVESVKALDPAGVFLAVGAEPMIPPIPGIDGGNVITAESVLLGQRSVTGKAVVIGSGMTGLETAEMLAGHCEKLTMVEMLSQLGTGIYPSVVSDVMSRITPHHPEVLMEHQLTRVTDKGVELMRLKDRQTVFVEADAVILAMGVRPRKALTDAFKAAFPKAIIIGDARKGGRILEATQDAQGKAFTFEP